MDMHVHFVESFVLLKMHWNYTSQSITVTLETYIFDVNKQISIPMFFFWLKIIFSQNIILTLGELDGYNFQDPSDLLQFLRKDKQDQKYYCTLCEKFSHKLSSCTRNHIESQHFPNYFTYSCDLCEMTFGTKTTLNLHRSRKHNPRNR